MQAEAKSGVASIGPSLQHQNRERGRQAISSKQDRIRVLVADDQPHVLEAVELLLKPQGIDVDCVRSPQLLLEALHERDYDVVLIDLNYTRDTTSGRKASICWPASRNSMRGFRSS